MYVTILPTSSSCGGMGVRGERKNFSTLGRIKKTYCPREDKKIIHPRADKKFIHPGMDDFIIIIGQENYQLSLFTGEYQVDK